MLKVEFYDKIDDALLAFAVIVSRNQGKWVFCKHRERDTLECPGGHREPGESILDTAKRELFEETGALEYDITPVCAYSVDQDSKITYGMLYFSDIACLGPLPELEIESVILTDSLPQRWTYPEIQPMLLQKAMTGKQV